jgi:hypothetical protein
MEVCKYSNDLHVRDFGFVDHKEVFICSPKDLEGLVSGVKVVSLALVSKLVLRVWIRGHHNRVVNALSREYLHVGSILRTPLEDLAPLQYDLIFI